MDNKQYEWVDYYKEFADILLNYKDNRQELIAKLKNVFSRTDMKFPKMESNGEVVDIDPFTVFGLFNKGLKDSNRISILKEISEEFGVLASVPSSFNGIPVLNPQKATFFWWLPGRGPHDIDNLWKLFECSIAYADSGAGRQVFCDTFDTVNQQIGIKWNITMGLYWIRPNSYIALDSRNRWFMQLDNMIDSSLVPALLSFEKNKSITTGDAYLDFCDKFSKMLTDGNYEYKSFVEFSYGAWVVSEEENKRLREEKRNNSVVDSDVRTKHYWLYSPGDNASKWDEYYANGVMAIGWGRTGDLKLLNSKEGIRELLQSEYDPNKSHKNNTHTLWQFANEIQPGDVVFAKKGMHLVIGRGVVESDYFFDDKEEDYKHKRKVKWTHNGEWQHPGQAAMKTLTDITPYTDYVDKLNALFEADAEDDVEDETPVAELVEYTKDDFLKDVYLDEAEYEKLVGLVRVKKNVILQGAPGVGKTYAAKRLAYSMMGVKDPERVMLVQFHQSYSYEDFIEGIRPTETHYQIKKGAFYNFCKKAEIDNENEYFFIIDEINRGNLSKIFGELFMLIENDKRGPRNEVQLLYSNEKFYVPENIHIIGMMNTADRSLAMLDYALRRRFSFYEMKPAFESTGFISYKQGLNSEKFSRLVACIESLNAVVSSDESLGDGFCIGHSYFCNIKGVSDQILSSIVEYEIIPLLKEYWFDEPTKVKDWSNNLRSSIK